MHRGAGQQSFGRAFAPRLPKLAVAAVLVVGTSIGAGSIANAAGGIRMMPSLFGVACPSANNCFAVGTRVGGSSNKSLIEHWDGASWSTMTSPNPSPVNANVILTGVACPTKTSCYAVGQYGANTWIRSVIEHWNGTKWSIVPSPNPYQELALLTGIACASDASCIAVGGPVYGGSALVEQWNGTSWSIVPSANPPRRLSQATLSGVTCSSSTNCIAVGVYRTDFGSPGYPLAGTLVERWNGSKWTVVATPKASGTFANLGDVACPSASSCFAVGHLTTATSDQSLIEHWNGATWSIVTSPNPPGNVFVELGGVACPGATSCYAVGAYRAGGGWGRTLAEHWNGTTWSIVTSPNPSGLNTAALDDIACPSVGSCVAVGRVTTGSTNATGRTLIERWGGAGWQISAAPLADVEPIGDAGFYGSTSSVTFNQPVVGIAATPSSHGYWEAAIDGGVYAYGDAHYRGSMGGTHLNQPIVGIAATKTGNGYWLAAATAASSASATRASTAPWAART